MNYQHQLAGLGADHVQPPQCGGCSGFSEQRGSTTCRPTGNPTPRIWKKGAGGCAVDLETPRTREKMRHVTLDSHQAGRISTKALDTIRRHVGSVT